MTLECGTQLGHYEISDQIGKGGMGEVYRARDMKLGREVAIKTLPPEFSEDPDRLARFEREAKLLASLNHPNIAAIYGLEEHEGTRFLVLELVEGDTLADRLKRGAIPVEESLKLALQIAEALEAAHEKGVIHRDLKPANIKVTLEGKVKVLDFGLAKAFAGDQPDSNLSNSPTLSLHATQAGIILGTAPYMSPEQARGLEVDKRTDIFAFGCVLLETLSGRQAFRGTLASDVLAAVIRAEPEWDGFPVRSHPGLRRLIARCLEKDVRQRWRDVGDIPTDLAEIAEDPGGERVAKPAVQRSHELLPWAVSLALLVALVLLFVGRDARPTVSAPATAEIPLPEGVVLAVDTEHPALALSPDGLQLIFVGIENGVSRLYRRDLASASFEAVPLEGTEDAADPFFSSSGDAIAFFAGDRLKTTALVSGVPTDVATVTGASVNRGAAWVADGAFVIAVSANDPLTLVRRLSEGVPVGGDTQELLAGTPQPSAWPAALHDGKSVLFTDNSQGPGGEGVGLFDLNTRDFVRLFDGGTNPRYSETGHILYARAGALYARPFDPATMTVGEERPLTAGLQMRDTGAAQLAVSANGKLAYVAGGLTTTTHELVWVNRLGDIVDTIAMDDRRIEVPRISPDGTEIALTSVSGANVDVFVWNIPRSSLTPWTTDAGEDFHAIWHPESGGLAFSTEIGSPGPAVGWMTSLNATPEEIFERPGDGNAAFPTSWSPDGRVLLVSTLDPQGMRDVVALDVQTGVAEPFLTTANYIEVGATFSPDGNWVAYVSDRTGTQQVWIAAYPEGEHRRVSGEAGGVEPVWSPDGSELFFREPNRLMSVTFSGGSGQADPPKPVFPDTFARNDSGSYQANYDVSADGELFLMVRRKNPVTPDHIRVVTNWPEVFGLEGN